MSKVHLIMSSILGKRGCYRVCGQYLGHSVVYPEIFKLIPIKHRCRLCQKKYEEEKLK